MEELVFDLFERGAIKFGEFTYKGNVKSPIHIDLKCVTFHQKLLEKIAFLVGKYIEDHGIQFDVVCGVPYTAIPIATYVAVKHRKPLVLKRKEVRECGGSSQSIEGLPDKIHNVMRVLIIDDIMITGASLADAVQALVCEGATPKVAMVVVDREQGGVEILRRNQVKVYSLMTVTQICEVLYKGRFIDKTMHDQVLSFLRQQNQIEMPPTKKMKKALTYDERMKLCENPVARRLFKIMANKETNLGLAADVTTSAELLQAADMLGPKICMLKTHVDQLNDFSVDIGKQLVQLADKHNFVIFEDRKFGDHSKITKRQFDEGPYQISKWADIVDAHSLPGPAVIEGLQQADGSGNKACLLVAEMPTEGNLADRSYKEATVAMAEKYSDFVIGFICQGKVSENPAHIHITPGISFDLRGTEVGQQIVTPKMAIKDRGSDIVVVGPGILRNTDQVEAAEAFRSSAFNAYKERLSTH